MNHNFSSFQDTTPVQSSNSHLFQNTHEQYLPSQLTNPAHPSMILSNQNLYQNGVPQQIPIGQISPGIISQGQGGQFLSPQQEQGQFLPPSQNQFQQGQGQFLPPSQTFQTNQLPSNPLSQLGSINQTSQNVQSQFYDPRSTMSTSQNVQAVQFGANITKSEIPKLIAIAEAPSGNINLYEVAELTILMVTNPPNMVINISSIKKSDKTYDTPHGPKSGYLFYKNNTEHIKLLDQLFPGSGWQEQLSKKLPEPTEKKTPELLWSGNINYSGRICTFYLYEYSDKTLAIFTPIDLSQSLSAFGKLVCPHVGGINSPGYMAFKSKPDHIKYLKTLIPSIDFETM